jgi:hypothetical protein
MKGFSVVLFLFSVFAAIIPPHIPVLDILCGALMGATGAFMVLTLSNEI